VVPCRHLAIDRTVVSVAPQLLLDVWARRSASCGARRDSSSTYLVTSTASSSALCPLTPLYNTILWASVRVTAFNLGHVRACITAPRLLLHNGPRTAHESAATASVTRRPCTPFGYSAMLVARTKRAGLHLHRVPSALFPAVGGVYTNLSSPGLRPYSTESTFSPVRKCSEFTVHWTQASAAITGFCQGSARPATVNGVAFDTATSCAGTSAAAYSACRPVSVRRQLAISGTLMLIAVICCRYCRTAMATVS
jgi:hypothetical protein